MSATSATVAIPDYLVGTWKADQVHSEIAFTVRHLMISRSAGRRSSSPTPAAEGQGFGIVA